MQRLALRPQEVAEALGIGASLAREIIASGGIASIRIGTRIVVPVSEVEAFLAREVAKAKDGVK